MSTINNNSQTYADAGQKTDSNSRAMADTAPAPGSGQNPSRPPPASQPKGSDSKKGHDTRKPADPKNAAEKGPSPQKK
ncbi:hypothetical protein TWF718_004121 [Orbilia javanica]|uniref:Uncharacterized protein n=1 Tax=Orbilia javanica TaxID=47235 RepID=A0AAN8N5S4_9PEZI